MGTLIAAGFVLFRVWGTVVFAVTVAYVLVPVHARLVDRGLSSWWASTVSAVLGTAAALLPIAVASTLVYRRRANVLSFLATLPAEFAIVFAGQTTVVDVTALFEVAEAALTAAVPSLVASLPVLALKATLFAFLVFGLLMNHASVEQALVAVVPPAHRDVAFALARRARRTLDAIYLLQAATGVVTFAFGAAVFWALGYDIPLTLGFVAGVLQFLPIVGPSVLIAALALVHVIDGAVLPALAVVLVGGIIVAWLPDVLVRPRLSRWTGDIDGTLYFVGFVGGLLTVGPIGIVVGPVAVALVGEAMALLASETAD